MHPAKLAEAEELSSAIRRHDRRRRWLLSVRDLQVDFRQGDSDGACRARRLLRHPTRRRPSRSSASPGSGKSVTALSILKLLPYPPAHHPGGSVLFKGQELLNADESTLRKVRGNEISMIFQEPMTSLNPLHTVERQVGEILEVHRGHARRGGARARAGASDPGRHPRAGEAGSAPIRTSFPAGSGSAS